jgi:aldehyde dehydrogenase (NAD+)
MYEQYHPMGTVGIISLSTFGSRFGLGIPLGRFVVMFAFGNHRKKTPLCGIACQNIIAEVIKKITSRRNV